MYGLGEKDMNLHCDNCSGQDKKRYVLFDFMWYVMRGLVSKVVGALSPVNHK